MASVQLPPEIWEDILRRCTHQSQLNLRLANKLLAGIAAPFAFSSIYIGCLPSYFERLEALSNSELRHCVHTINIELAVIKWPLTELAVVDRTKGYNEAEMNRRINEQRTIFSGKESSTMEWLDRETAGQYRKTLLKAIPKFDKLTSIQGIDACDLAEPDEHVAFNSKAPLEFGPWILEGLDEAEQYQGPQYRRLQRYRDLTGQRCPFTHFTGRYRSIRGRGEDAWLLQTILMVINACGGRVTLFCCAELPWLEDCLQIAHKPKMRQQLDRATRNLRMLDLKLESYLGETMPDTGAAVDHPLFPLVESLNQAQNLETVILHFDIEDMNFETIAHISSLDGGEHQSWIQDDVFNSLNMRALKYLSMSFIYVERYTFTDFLERHKDTLRGIHSVGSFMEEDWGYGGALWREPSVYAATNSWEDALTEAASILSLEFLDLGFMADRKIELTLQQQAAKINGEGNGIILWENQVEYCEAAWEYVLRKGEGVRYPSVKDVRVVDLNGSVYNRWSARIAAEAKAREAASAQSAAQN